MAVVMHCLEGAQAEKQRRKKMDGDRTQNRTAERTEGHALAAVLTYVEVDNRHRDCDGEARVWMLHPVPDARVLRIA